MGLVAFGDLDLKTDLVAKILNYELVAKRLKKTGRSVKGQSLLIPGDTDTLASAWLMFYDMLYYASPFYSSKSEIPKDVADAYDVMAKMGNEQGDKIKPIQQRIKAWWDNPSQAKSIGRDSDAVLKGIAKDIGLKNNWIFDKEEILVKAAKAIAQGVKAKKSDGKKDKKSKAPGCSPPGLTEKKLGKVTRIQHCGASGHYILFDPKGKIVGKSKGISGTEEMSAQWAFAAKYGNVPEFTEEDVTAPEEEHKSSLPLILGGIGVLAIGGTVAFFLLRKKK
mgnify:CR=1 FL=1